MLKTLVLILGLFTCLPLFSQKSNIANVNTMLLWESMPEKKSADSVLMQLNMSYSEHFNKMNQEIELLIANYKADDKSTPAIKADMVKDIESRQVRMETFKKEAESDLAKKREELLAPIRKKMQDAINSVAKKNKYDYVLDSSFGNIIYAKNTADDILELVKKELGL